MLSSRTVDRVWRQAGYHGGVLAASGLLEAAVAVRLQLTDLIGRGRVRPAYSFRAARSLHDRVERQECVHR
jgi:hypothetical protein